jgi:hypothetical protein
MMRLSSIASVTGIVSAKETVLVMRVKVRASAHVLDGVKYRRILRAK